MSRPDQAIYLIGANIIEDEIGNQIEIPIEVSGAYTVFPAMGLGVCPNVIFERMVFAEELAIFSSEFYNAALTGLRPEKIFEIYTQEYDGEAKLKHNNITYRIIRTSLGKTKEKPRLTCEKVAADG